MTREEMIEMMVHRFEYCRNNQDIFDNHEAMDYVLKGQEAVGMLPPTQNFDPDEVFPRNQWDAIKIETPLKELTSEGLLAQGVCPCGNVTSYGCSVTGCPLYLQELDLKTRVFQTWRQG